MTDDSTQAKTDIEDTGPAETDERAKPTGVTANPYAAKPVADSEGGDASENTPIQAASTAQAAALGDIVDRISAVLETENALLTRPNSQALGPVVARKQALFIEYEAWLRAHGDLRAVMAELPPEERAALLDRAKRFDALLRENEVKLDAMVKSGEHIMGVISEVARRAAQPVRGYGAAGSINAASQTVAPVAVNGTY